MLFHFFIALVVSLQNSIVSILLSFVQLFRARSSPQHLWLALDVGLGPGLVLIDCSWGAMVWVIHVEPFFLRVAGFTLLTLCGSQGHAIARGEACRRRFQASRPPGAQVGLLIFTDSGWALFLVHAFTLTDEGSMRQCFTEMEQ